MQLFNTEIPGAEAHVYQKWFLATLQMTSKLRLQQTRQRVLSRIHNRPLVSCILQPCQWMLTLYTVNAVNGITCELSSIYGKVAIPGMITSESALKRLFATPQATPRVTQ